MVKRWNISEAVARAILVRLVRHQRRMGRKADKIAGDVDEVRARAQAWAIAPAGTKYGE